MKEDPLSRDEAYKDYLSELKSLWDNEHPTLIPEKSYLFEFILIYVLQSEAVILGDSLFTHYRDEYPDFMLIERNEEKLRYHFSNIGMLLIPPKLTIEDYLTIEEDSLFFEDEFLKVLNKNDDGTKVTLEDINLIGKTSFDTTLHIGEYVINTKYNKWDNGDIRKRFEIVFGIETQIIQYEKHEVTEVNREIEYQTIKDRKTFQQYLSYIPKSIAVILQGGDRDVVLTLCFEVRHIEMIRLSTRGVDWNLTNSFYWETGKRDPEYAEKDWYLVGEIKLKEDKLIWVPSQNLVYRNDDYYKDWMEVQTGEELNDRVKRFIMKDEKLITSFFDELGILYEDIIEDSLSNGLDVSTPSFNW